MRHKLIFENRDINYKLITIRTKFDDYRLAYFLNKLPIFQFERKEKDIYCINDKKKVFFSTFEYKNAESKRCSFLIQNKAIIKSQLNVSNTLFLNSIVSKVNFLIPELKKIDYFLKLVGIWTNEEVKNLKENINKILLVEAETGVELSKIKSINNLVF